MKRFIVSLCVLFSAVWFCSAKADAITEFCPARVERVTSGVAGGAPSATFSYELNAKTPRNIVDASIVADTDHGWFRWRLGAVPMPMVSEKVWTNTGSYTHAFAQSPRLEVSFPEPLLVRHAWITSAQASDETVLGWGSKGEFACQVPTFSDRGAKTVELARSQSRAAAASPPPASAAQAPASGVAAAATPTTLPFDSIDCALPFHQATVTMAVSPDYPMIARESGVSGTVMVDIALDEQGHIIDASIYSGSGYGPLDVAAVKAAQKSSYAGAVSYCQMVRGEYLFTATFGRGP
jgi:TonB family protein